MLCYLSGFNIADNRLVSRGFDGLIGVQEHVLPAVELQHVRISERKHRTRSVYELTAVARKPAGGTLSEAFIVSEEPAFSWSKCLARFQPFLAYSYVHLLKLDNFYFYKQFCEQLRSVTETVSVGTLELHDCSALAIKPYLFKATIFSFERIQELDLTSVSCSNNQLDNEFLSVAVAKGISRLHLPRVQPFPEDTYDFNFEGVAAFLGSANGGECGRIALTAYSPAATPKFKAVVPRVS